MHLFNLSLACGQFPTCFKVAFITPVLKKPSLPASEPASYRPISNLSIISKLLERLVAKQLVSFLLANQLLLTHQSGFRVGHSTESAITKVLSDLLNAVDNGDTAILVLLDLSAAFDTVDHTILLERLNTSFGICDSALNWFVPTLLAGVSMFAVAASALIPLILSVVSRRGQSLAQSFSYSTQLTYLPLSLPTGCLLNCMLMTVKSMAHVALASPLLFPPPSQPAHLMLLHGCAPTDSS